MASELPELYKKKDELKKLIKKLKRIPRQDIDVWNDIQKQIDVLEAEIQQLKDEDIYLRLNASDPIVLNVVAHDLGIEDYSRQDRHELVENIMKDRSREAILNELENDWDDLLLKLTVLDEDSLNSVAMKLGIKNCAEQKFHELVENILKERERKAILRALKVRQRWAGILVNSFLYISTLASIISLFFYTNMGKDMKEWFSPSVTTNSGRVALSSDNTEHSMQSLHIQIGDKVAERFINNVVQLTVELANGDMMDGFGFVSRTFMLRSGKQIMIRLACKMTGLMILVIFWPVTDVYAQDGDKVGKRFVNNVLQLTVKFSNGDETNGFGFVVDEREQKHPHRHGMKRGTSEVEWRSDASVLRAGRKREAWGCRGLVP